MRMQPFNRSAPAAIAAVVIGLVLLLRADPALAQVGGTLDDATDAMATLVSHAGDRLRDWTRRLLLSLLVLDFVWRSGRWLLSGQSVSAFAEPMLYTIGIVSLAWGFAEVGPEVVSWIAAEATSLGGHGPQQFVPHQGAGRELRPSGILSDGLARTQAWIGKVGAVPSTWAFLVCAFISLVVLAATLAMLILVYAELYMVGLVGVATLGFAGLTQTRGVASRYVMALVGKGFKLLTLLLVVDATHRLALMVADGNTVTTTTTFSPTTGPQTVQGTSVTLEGVLGAVLMQIIGGVLVILLPGAVERLVGGSSVGDVAGTGAKMVAGTAATGLAAGGAAAVGAAGGAAAPVMGNALNALKTGAPLSGKETVKAALTGGLQGGMNWGSLGKDGKIMNELGRRLRGRVNNLGSEKGSEGGGR